MRRLLALFPFILVFCSTNAFPEPTPPPAIKSAMASLTEGNQRYVSFQLTHPHQTVTQRLAISEKQTPFAAILSCADSRVPPEIVFDTGLGDLFVVRVAGNVVDAAVTGSLEYAVEHLNVPVVMVLGHTHCGAVQASVQGNEYHTHIETLIRDIRPAVREARHETGDLVDNAVRDNIRRSVMALRSDRPFLSPRYHAGQITIIGALYHMDTGVVEVLPD